MPVAGIPHATVAEACFGAGSVRQPGEIAVVSVIARGSWPDSIDRVALLLFLSAVIVLPLTGYWLAALDLRRWLRALRGMLVQIALPQAPLPNWVGRETPPCLRALGLSLPCTEDDVKQAYHRRAEALHPDRGGDIQRFLLLQRQLEQSLYFLQQRERDR